MIAMLAVALGSFTLGAASMAWWVARPSASQRSHKLLPMDAEFPVSRRKSRLMDADGQGVR